jgi:hypothetical protein
MATARDYIAELAAFFAQDEHASPEQLADYQHRLESYGRTGTPMQAPLELPPCA